MVEPFEIELEPEPPRSRAGWRRRSGRVERSGVEQPAPDFEAGSADPTPRSFDPTARSLDPTAARSPPLPAEQSPEQPGESSGARTIDRPGAGVGAIAVIMAVALVAAGVVVGRTTAPIGDPPVDDSPAGDPASADGSADDEETAEGLASDEGAGASPGAADRPEPDLESRTMVLPRPTPAAPGGTAAGSPTVRVEEVGWPLGPRPTGLVVVGVTTGGDLIEIEIDRGAIRRTVLPDRRGVLYTPKVIASESVTLVVDSTLPRQASSWVIPLGEPARTGGEALAGMIAAYLAPSPGEVWVQYGVTGPVPPAAVLHRVDLIADEVVGRTGVAEVERAYSDGRGGLLLEGIGGTYVVGPDGTARHLSPGVVLGVGPHHVVVHECDAVLRCGASRIALGPAERTALPQVDRWATRLWGPDVVSPDGSRMAGFDVSVEGEGFRYVVVDLDDGSVTTMFAIDTASGWSLPPVSTLAWSVDGRLVIHATGGRLAYYDVVTGERGSFGGMTVLPNLRSFTVRTDPLVESTTEVPPRQRIPRRTDRHRTGGQRGSSRSRARSAAQMSSRSSATIRLR